MHSNLYRSRSIHKTAKQFIVAIVACCIMLFPGAFRLQAQAPADAFETTWSGSSVTIPTYSGEIYSYNVYWEEVGNLTNNGSSNGHTDDVTLDFGADGTYRVYIQGTFPHFYLKGSEDSLKLQAVEQWGNIAWSSMASAFHGAENLVISATDKPDLSGVTDMSNMFRGATSFNQDISHWNVSSVNDMSGMFSAIDIIGVLFDGKNAMSFNQDLSGWNVGNVTDMSYMFSGAFTFNQDLSGWNVGNVRNMSYMFEYDTLFNYPLDSWSVGNVEDMSYMFTEAVAFDQDLNSWNVSKVTNMEGMFYSADVFNGNIADWNVGNVENMYRMFRFAERFNRDIGNWNVENVTNMQEMLSKTAFNQDIGKWKVSNVTNMHQMFSDVVSFNQDLSGWDVSEVTDMGGMFEYTEVFNQPVGSWNVSKVANMKSLFKGATAFNQDISGWNVSGATNMGRMFKGASSFNQDISGWNVSGVTDMSFMFEGASAFNQDISGWDVSKVENMSLMFKEASVFDQDLSGWNVSNVEDMSLMFNAADAFNQPLGGWDVSNVNYMRSMFGEADAFNQDLSGWNVSKVKDMDQMFRNSGAFNQPLDSWDIGSVTSMRQMFEGAKAFNQDLSGWDVSNVVYLINMFTNAHAFDVTSYSATLDGWALGNLKSNRILDTVGTVGNPTPYYSTVQSARDKLTNNHSWTIIDGGSEEGYKLTYKAKHATLLGDSVQYIAPGGDGTAVTVVPDPDFEFPGWLDGRTDNPRTDINIMKDSTMTAIMRIDTSSAFVTIWSGSSVTIPTYSGEVCSYGVYWEEVGNPANNGFSSGLTGEVTLDFGADGTYRIYINGVFPRFYLNNSSDALKLRAIERWGDIAWTSMEAAFKGAGNLDTYTATDAPDLSGVTNMRQMFRGATKFNGDISGWDVSNVTNMQEMFQGASLFNQDIGGWNVSNVTNMQEMFRNADAFQHSILNWDVGNVITMKEMFAGTDAFNHYIGGWNVSNVSDMEGMFAGADAFNQDIGNWDVDSVKNMSRMFSAAKVFNQDLSRWDVDSVKDMRRMFSAAWAFNQDIGGWNVSNVIDMEGMFLDARVFNQDISNWDVSNVTNMREMFSGAGAFNQDIGKWDVGTVEDMYQMFYWADAFNQDIGKWDVSKVQNMSGMFRYSESFDQSLGGWDVSGVTNFVHMFSNALAFSPASWSETLEGWAALSGLSPNKNFGTIGPQDQPTPYYSMVQPARDVLTGNYLWIFNDGGPVEGYKLTYNAGDHTTLSGDTIQYVDSGANGSAVTVVPGTGYSFLSWSDGNTDNPRTDTGVSTDITVVANVIRDNTPPVITLFGDDLMYLGAGDSYNEPGATAADDFDGDISGNIIIGGDIVDTDTEGTYVVTYNVSDAAGNEAPEVTRTVVVDLTAPVTALMGDNPLYISQGEVYIESGATATDNMDGNISDNILIGGDVVDPDTEGTYRVTYNVSDAAGNAATRVERTVIVDHTAPVISLLGDNPMHIGPGEAYTEPGAIAIDDLYGDISDNVIIGGDIVDNDTEGTYVVSYNVSDAAGNAAPTAERTVIVDHTAPVISLLGDDPLYISQGETYTEPGAIATDNLDGDISDNVVISGDLVDTGTENTYMVTYNVSDAAGNATMQVRNVIVDLTAPTITLLGDNLMHINLGDTFTDPGAIATDNRDGDISNNIVIGGDVVNPGTEGTYRVTYNVSDAAGNAASQVERTVIVDRLITSLEPESAHGDDGMVLYPNPAREEVHIRLSRPGEIRQILLFGPDGRLVRTYQGEEIGNGDVYTLDLSSYPTTTYFVHVIDHSGQRFRKQLSIK